MLKKAFFILSLLISFKASAQEQMPADVQDMITTFTQEIKGGRARDSLKATYPYNPYQPRQVKQLTREEKLSKAKFNLDLKVISCKKEEMPDFLKEKKKTHDACGDLTADIIFDDKLELYLTKESKFNNLKPSKVIRTIPEIVKEGDNYTIKDKQIVNTVNLGVEVFAVPTTIIERQVQLDIAVRTTELADIDEVYLDSNDKNFVNDDVALQHRFLVASFPVDINSLETLGGNSAILVPVTSDFKSAKNYPETARLWLEVKLGLPL
jgi:hypothetical protein